MGGEHHVGRLTRRRFVRLAAGAAGLAGSGALGAVLEACGGEPAPPARVEADVSKLYAAAKKEGTVTWWVSSYEQSVAEIMAGAFKKKYPGVEVNLLRQTAQVLYTRLNQELKAGATDCDVFVTTDESQFPPLIKAGALTRYTPPDLGLLPAQFQNLNADHRYHLGSIGFQVINYRTDRVSTPPKRWQDLLDPQWSGKITTGHPGFSGYVGQWVTAMLRTYGNRYLDDLARNKPKVNRSVNDTVTDIIAGERVVGSGPANFSLARKLTGSPVDIVFPSDGAVLVPGIMGILAGSKRPNAARLLVNFTYSKEFSEALVSTGDYPLRSDVKPPAGVPALDQIKVIRNTVDQLTKDLPGAVDRWRETMGV